MHLAPRGVSYSKPATISREGHAETRSKHIWLFLRYSIKLISDRKYCCLNELAELFPCQMNAGRFVLCTLVYVLKGELVIQDVDLAMTYRIPDKPKILHCFQRSVLRTWLLCLEATKCAFLSHEFRKMYTIKAFH